MKRSDILSRAIFDTGGEVDGIKFGPLSPPNLVVLKRRRNSLFAPSNRDQDTHEAIGEILFVLSRGKDERQALFRATEAEWEDAVAAFIVGLDDDTIRRFHDEYLHPAMEALQASAVESEGPGKEGPSPAISPTSSKEPSAQDSTRSPVPST